MSDDITQDPEYIKGYEAGIKQYRDNQSPYTQGFIIGLHALETPKTVESKAFPAQSKPDEIAQLKEQVQQFDERLTKLEKYTQE